MGNDGLHLLEHCTLVLECLHTTWLFVFMQTFAPRHAKDKCCTLESTPIFFSSKAVITFYAKLWSQLLISPPKRQSATRCVPRRRKSNYRARSQLGLTLKRKHDIKHVEIAIFFPSTRLKSTSTARPSAANFPRARTVSDEWSLPFCWFSWI